MSDYELKCGDALALMRELPDNSIDLIATDPPYYRVKDEAWDNQWDTPELFIAWMGELCAEWQRILKPNGSLFVFASPRMAARVEVEMGRWFNVLNRVRWIKEAGWHNKTEKEALRSFLSPWEEIIFAERFPVWPAMLREAHAKTEVSSNDIAERITGKVTGAFRNWRDGTSLPTPEHWVALAEFFPDLPDYSDVVRPFTVTPDVPFTDVWKFKTVEGYAGKHPCEKPVSLMKHIINSSSKKGATVLDCFAGSGSTGVACAELGRNFIGIELDAKYYAQAQRRIEAAQSQGIFDLAVSP